MPKITIAIQPFNGLTKEEIGPIERKIRSVYNVDTVVLDAVYDSGFIYEEAYVRGPSVEECVDFLRGMKKYKFKVGVTRSLLGTCFCTPDREISMIDLIPRTRTDRLLLDISLCTAVHEIGHLLGMYHCWDYPSYEYDENCYMGTISASRNGFCKKHKSYLLRKGLLNHR